MKFKPTRRYLIALFMVLCLSVGVVIGKEWQEYTDFTGTIADDDTLMIRNKSDTTDDAVYGSLNEMEWQYFKANLESFDTFEFPNGNDCSSIANDQAEACHDNNNYAIAVDDNTNTRYYSTRTKCFEPVIWAEPDQMQPISDTWPVMRFPAEQFPAGFVIEAIQITTSSACTDTLDFREYSQNGTSWSNDSQIESITLSGVFTEDDGTLADANIAADAEIWINMDDSTDNIAWMAIQICGQIPINN
jgi:hypothetical protein